MSKDINDTLSAKLTRGSKTHMQTIKEICKSRIGLMNYKQDTKTLTEMVYKEFGLELIRVNGLDLLNGSSKVPKLMSVIRRIQITKKGIASKVKRDAIKKEMEDA